MTALSDDRPEPERIARRELAALRLREDDDADAEADPTRVAEAAFLGNAGRAAGEDADLADAPPVVAPHPERPVALELVPPSPEELAAAQTPRRWDDGADALRAEIEEDARQAEIEAIVRRPNVRVEMRAAVIAAVAAALAIDVALLPIAALSPKVGVGVLIRFAAAHAIANAFLGIGWALARGGARGGIAAAAGVAAAGPVVGAAFYLALGEVLAGLPAGLTGFHRSVVDQLVRERTAVAILAAGALARGAGWIVAANQIGSLGSNASFRLGSMAALGIAGSCLVLPPFVLTEPAVFAIVRGWLHESSLAEERASVTAALRGDPGDGPRHVERDPAAS